MGSDAASTARPPHVWGWDGRPRSRRTRAVGESICRGVAGHCRARHSACVGAGAQQGRLRDQRAEVGQPTVYSTWHTADGHGEMGDSPPGHRRRRGRRPRGVGRGPVCHRESGRAVRGVRGIVGYGGALDNCPQSADPTHIQLIAMHTHFAVRGRISTRIFIPPSALHLCHPGRRTWTGLSQSDFWPPSALCAVCVVYE
jgi:hypothetical protein